MSNKWSRVAKDQVRLPNVPRQGPPVNLRPAGAHKGIKDRTRAEQFDEAICEQLDEKL